MSTSDRDALHDLRPHDENGSLLKELVRRPTKSEDNAAHCPSLSRRDRRTRLATVQVRNVAVAHTRQPYGSTVQPSTLCASLWGCQ